jgi:GntR family transcriptional regulator, transcriptional repressor for pyruvate dehydrogenase complex
LTTFKPQIMQSDLDDIVTAIRQVQQDGGKLPSERDLAELLKVKRHQLRKALGVMRHSGDLGPARARRAPTTLPRYNEELVRVTNPLADRTRTCAARFSARFIVRDCPDR